MKTYQGPERRQRPRPSNSNFQRLLDISFQHARKLDKLVPAK